MTYNTFNEINVPTKPTSEWVEFYEGIGIVVKPLGKTALATLLPGHEKLLSEGYDVKEGSGPSTITFSEAKRLANALRPFEDGPVCTEWKLGQDALIATSLHPEALRQRYVALKLDSLDLFGSGSLTDPVEPPTITDLDELDEQDEVDKFYEHLTDAIDWLVSDALCNPQYPPSENDMATGMAPYYDEYPAMDPQRPAHDPVAA